MVGISEFFKKLVNFFIFNFFNLEIIKIIKKNVFIYRAAHRDERSFTQNFVRNKVNFLISFKNIRKCKKRDKA